MKSCKKCGAELADEAVICPSCGETQALNNNKSSFDNSFFSMPYLSVEKSKESKNKNKTEIKNDTISEDEDNNKKASEKNNKLNSEDKLTDPLERAFAKRDKRNKIIRIIALIIVCVIIISTGIYFIFRSSGYHRTLDKYIDGRTSSSGTNYLSIVPEIYLINAESLYNMKRPDIKSNTNDYLEYVEEQYKSDFGNNLKFSYKITSERTVNDANSIKTLEDSIYSTYSTNLDISEIAYVTIRLTTKGSITQSTENKTLTFYKYDNDWDSLGAMEIVSFACENAGYNVW